MASGREVRPLLPHPGHGFVQKKLDQSQQRERSRDPGGGSQNTFKEEQRREQGNPLGVCTSNFRPCLKEKVAEPGIIKQNQAFHEITCDLIPILI